MPRTRKPATRKEKIKLGIEIVLEVGGHVSPRVRQLARVGDSYLAGLSVGKIARVNHVSKRTVYRRLEELTERGSS
jgi:DNA invertase Pin-like site-specific DNA recombinase